jgi:Transmembrane protein 43
MQIYDTTGDSDDWRCTILCPLIGLALLWFSIQYQLETEYNAVGLLNRLTVTELTPASAASVQSKLVHFTGFAQSDGGITDPLCGISTKTGLSLRRKVQKFTASGEFVDQTTTASVNSLVLQPSRATAGFYVIPKQYLCDLPTTNLVQPTREAANILHKKLGRPVQATTDILYVGKNPLVPKVGDLKITYWETPAQQISIVAAKDKNSFSPYAVRQLISPIIYVTPGDVDAATILRPHMPERKIDLMAMRWTNLTVVLAALCLFEAPIVFLYTTFPTIGNLFGQMITPFQIATSCVVTGVITAAAWLRHEPLFALAMILVTWAAAVAGVCVFKFGMALFQRLNFDPQVGLYLVILAKVGLIIEGAHLGIQSVRVFAGYGGQFPITPY